MDFCNISLSGNLVQKPDIRYLPNPVTAVAEFTLASHQYWFDKTTQQTKKWTHFHSIMAVGEMVESALQSANKGDVLVLTATMLDDQKTGNPILLANFIRHFNKGYSGEFNQIECSGTVNAKPHLNRATNNKLFLELAIKIQHSYWSIIKQKAQSVVIERKVHYWGNKVEALADTINIGDTCVLSGNLGYLQDKSKTPLIEAKKLLCFSANSA